MSRYYKFVDNNIPSLEGKNVMIIGATGSLGGSLCDYLLRLKANLLITMRNKVKGEKLVARLKEKYPDSNISLFDLDLASISSCKSFIENSLKLDIDYLVLSAAVYHLKRTMVENDFEIHFLTNYVNQLRIVEALKDNIKNRNGKIIMVGSISYRFSKENFDDIMSLKVINKTKVYARSKRLAMIHCSYLKSTGYPLVLAHPGVSPTGLFNAGGFGKLFNILIVPIMKLIFMSPKKAALSILYAFGKDVKEGYQIGPRGLFHVWGYPTVYKLHKSVLDRSKQEDVVDMFKYMISIGMEE